MNTSPLGLVRHSRSCAIRPDGTLSSSRLASVAFDTVLPFTDRMMSPGRICVAALLLGSTSVTSAPLLPDGSCTRREICGVTLLSVTPNPLLLSSSG